jgi:putative Mg2+ transporter-C (MgtC) family protein
MGSDRLAYFLDLTGGLRDAISSWGNQLIVWLSSMFQTELTFLDESNALLLLVVATLCGAATGLERELANKAAGLRTNILICVGSTLFTLASFYSWQLAGSPPTIDPARIAANIVTGVGFIGAGVILTKGPQITGITTAATIWLVAAIGMVIGLGLPLLGLLVAAFAASALFLLGRIERKFSHNEE